MGTLGPFPFYENSNPSNFFRTVFLSARVLPLVRICGGVRAQILLERVILGMVNRYAKL